jgi:hypothetical protein
MIMGQQRFLTMCVSGLVLGACALQVDGQGSAAADLKPEDASELAGANVGTSQHAHTLHYTDGTNQWNEPNYPMGRDNPNCHDWWVYDRYLSSRPNLGWSKYSTYQTNHPWAQGTYVNDMMATLPTELGYPAGIKQLLIDHNTAVARASGKCSGRYVFQFDNRTAGGPFGANRYYFSANIPENIDPSNEAACNARAPHTVAATLMDVYVCEAPSSMVTTVGYTGPAHWCARDGIHWRLAGSSATMGTWSAGSCNTAATHYYVPPSGKIAVSFNVAIKSGIGHGVAPADLWIHRYD